MTLSQRFARPSIRRRLVLLVGLVVAIATAGQVMLAYRGARAEIDIISDFHMVQMGRAVRKGMPESQARLILPAPVSPAFATEQENTFTLSVQRVDNAEALRPFPLGIHHFSTRRHGDQVVRVLYIEAPGIQIEVAHNLASRERMARAMAMRSIRPLLLIFPLLLAGVWFGTTLALRPMRRTRNEVARRGADDLRPLATVGVPEEALPFVAEINTLFARIDAEFQARRDFTADVAHELRSPLAALKLQVQCLVRAQTPEARAVHEGRVMAGIARATRLVEQLLVLAREDSATPAATFVTLPQVARLALSDVLAQAQERATDLGAELQENLPEAVFTVRGDADALRTLLRNLLDNAIKYAPPGGVVNLVLRREGASIVVSVEDNGPGIEPAERAQLFERFRRGRSGQDTGGSGLGLAIVRAIANRQGVTIDVASSAALGGLAVTLRFAAADAPPA
ncbi:MAG: ATP-binding protein [Candidatus Dactylopiibacterium sp.]|nr:ATP-binding protein [Candidatus Dactylopiibacterium sp.]